jgi:hypothetical protein
MKTKETIIGFASFDGIEREVIPTLYTPDFLRKICGSP